MRDRREAVFLALTLLTQLATSFSVQPSPRVPVVQAHTRPARTSAPVLLAKKKKPSKAKRTAKRAERQGDAGSVQPAPAAPVAPVVAALPVTPAVAPAAQAMPSVPDPVVPAAPASLPAPAPAAGDSAAARRAARRAKRRGNGAAVPPPVVAAVAAPPPAVYAPPPAPAVPSPMPVSDDPLADPFFAPSLGSFADALPSMDDFRQRDAAERADAFAAASSPAPPSAPLTPQEQVQERLMELFTFDSIDERPKDEEPYDYTARLIGRGLPNKAGVYPLPYLQSGHTLLFGVLLLCTIVQYPGFPLTEVPDAYRGLLMQGIGITLGINFLTAVYSRGIAERKEEPVVFWFIKCCLLGGLALGELSEAVPMPTKPRNGRGAGR